MYNSEIRMEYRSLLQTLIFLLITILKVTEIFCDSAFTNSVETRAETKWCEALSEYGKPDFGVCLQDDDGISRYMIETMPVLAPGINLRTDVSIILVGSLGHTKPIEIAQKDVGTEKRVFVERLDIGDPEYIIASTSSKNTWRCQYIRVWKGYRYWVFDCIGTLDAKNMQQLYYISGNKLYSAVVQTGTDEKAGTAGGVEIALVGTEKQSSPKFLHQGFATGSEKMVQFRAADVGEIKQLIVRVTANDDPWYCDYIRIKDGRKAYSFVIKRWIGLPYEGTVNVELNSAMAADPVTQDIECHTRASDLFTRIPENHVIQRVQCPMNCQASEFAHVEGSSIHPSSSSICASGIHDGVISHSGGELVVTIVGSLPKYYGSGTNFGIQAVDYEPSPNKPTFSYYLYRLNSIDDIKKDLRVVDSYGKLASSGRLEVRRQGIWGTVCLKGDFSEFTPESAKKACQLLGYLHGDIDSMGCHNVNGQNVCGDKGYPVSIAGIACRGDEQSILDCSYEEPGELCQRHDRDVAIHCTNNPADREPLQGTLRLVDSSGAPTTNGIGRLEYYQDGFGTVCRDGWRQESEGIACSEMGYNGVKDAGLSNQTCSNIFEENYCGTEQQIALVAVACEGTETSIRRCPHETSSDIYCVHEEDVVIACDGDGDPTGLGLHMKQPPPAVGISYFPPTVKLKCSDRPMTRPEMQGPPGTTYIVSCPELCDDEPGTVKGTYIYTDDSPICKAAVHSGAIFSSGGEAVVTLTSSQKGYFGTTRNNIVTNDSPPYPRSFLVSKTSQMLTLRKSPADAESKVSEGAKEASKPGNSLGFPSFKQENSPVESNELEAKFIWVKPEDWRGFRGKPRDYIDTSDLPGVEQLSGFQDFTLSVTATVIGGESSWRSLLSYSDCDGFMLAINPKGEIIFEQNCHPAYISSGFAPKLNEQFNVTITYFKPEKGIGIFVNGKKLLYRKSDFDFHLTSHLEIGRAGEVETEYFVGDIAWVQIFDYVLSVEQINEVIKKKLKIPPGALLRPYIKEEYTEDGRLCISPCSTEPLIGGKAHGVTMPTNPALLLDCRSNLLSPAFDGFLRQKILVRCPKDCAKQQGVVLKGCKLYTSDSSICKAGLHANALPEEGGEMIVVIHSGLYKFKASVGRYGISSQSEENVQVRSFSVSKAPQIRHLSCAEDAGFVMKLGVDERALVNCPPGCAEVDAPVYGTETYSPISSVCRSAIHAGVLNDSGGEVEISVAPAQTGFVATLRNEITSSKSGFYLRSYKFNSGSLHLSKEKAKTEQKTEAKTEPKTEPNTEENLEIIRETNANKN